MLTEQEINLWEVSEIELVYKTKIPHSKRPKIIRSQDACNIFRQHWNGYKIELLEQSKVIYLNSANRVLGMAELSTGGINATTVDPRLILAMALKIGATAIILCHNHPSGSLNPSTKDLQLTEKIKQAASLFDITLADHIILTSESYYSFGDEGML